MSWWWAVCVCACVAHAQDDPYCGVRYERLCQGKGPHVACQYPFRGAGPACENYTTIIFSNDLKQFILHYVNRRRQKIASGHEKVRGGMHLPKPEIMMLVQWDRELAYLAQRLADQCQFVHDDCRATVRYPYAGQTVGEVRWRRSGKSLDRGARRTVARVFDAWWGERRRVHANQLTSPFVLTARGAVWGHFSQLAVWTLRAMGCGAVHHGRSRPRLLLVCDFSHTNMLGQRTLAPGAPAPCPRHTVRGTRPYPLLCAPPPVHLKKITQDNDSAEEEIDPEETEDGEEEEEEPEEEDEELKINRHNAENSDVAFQTRPWPNRPVRPIQETEDVDDKLVGDDTSEPATALTIEQDVTSDSEYLPSRQSRPANNNQPTIEQDKDNTFVSMHSDNLIATKYSISDAGVLDKTMETDRQRVRPIQNFKPMPDERVIQYDRNIHDDMSRHEVRPIKRVRPMLDVRPVQKEIPKQIDRPRQGIRPMIGDGPRSNYVRPTHDVRPKIDDKPRQDFRNVQDDRSRIDDRPIQIHRPVDDYTLKEEDKPPQTDWSNHEHDDTDYTGYIRPIQDDSDKPDKSKTIEIYRPGAAKADYIDTERQRVRPMEVEEANSDSRPFIPIDIVNEAHRPIQVAENARSTPTIKVSVKYREESLSSQTMNKELNWRNRDLAIQNRLRSKAKESEMINSDEDPKHGEPESTDREQKPSNREPNSRSRVPDPKYRQPDSRNRESDSRYKQQDFKRLGSGHMQQENKAMEKSDNYRNSEFKHKGEHKSSKGYFIRKDLDNGNDVQRKWETEKRKEDTSVIPSRQTHAPVRRITTMVVYRPTSLYSVQTEPVFRQRWMQTRARPKRPGANALINNLQTANPPHIVLSSKKVSMMLDKDEQEQLYQDTGFKISTITR